MDLISGMEKSIPLLNKIEFIFANEDDLMEYLLQRGV
jgi:hypothetical protein